MDFALLNEGYSVKKILSFISGSEAPSSTLILYKERRKYYRQEGGDQGKVNNYF